MTSQAGGAGPRGSGGNTVDVLVVYSTAAKNVSGGTSGMQSKINLAITETNDAYTLSGSTWCIPRRLSAIPSLPRSRRS